MDLLKALDQKISVLEARLKTLVAARRLLASEDKGGDAPFPKPAGRMSAKGRAAIARAQKKRWREVRAAKKTKRKT